MLPVIGKCAKSASGTKVTFYPDPEIFETIHFKPEVIKKKLKEIAFLNKNLKLLFKNEMDDEEIVYLEEFGIQSFVRYINRDAIVLHEDPIYIEGKSGDIEVEIAFQYTTNFSEQINPYCNRINVVDGGTLVTGFKTGLTRVMNQYARRTVWPSAESASLRKIFVGQGQKFPNITHGDGRTMRVENLLRGGARCEPTCRGPKQ